MINDALKLVRSLHGLIIVSSLFTVVFSISLNVPQNEVKWRDALRLISPEAYTTYVIAAAAPIRQTLNEDIRNFLDEHNQVNRVYNLLASELQEVRCIDAPVFESDSLIDTRTKDAVSIRTMAPVDFSIYPTTVVRDDEGQEVAMATDMYLSAARDTRLVAELDEGRQLVGKCTLNRENIDDCKCSDLQPFDDVQNFTLSLSGLVIPQFLNYQITAKLRARLYDTTIPNGSFGEFMESKLPSGGVIAYNLEKNEIRFDPPLTNEYLNQPIARLIGKLEEDVVEITATSIHVSVLGNQLRGLTVFYASPSAIIVLLYLFLGHVMHLHGFATSHLGTFREFSWLPLVRPNWLMPLIDFRSLYTIVSFIGLVFLPTGSLIFLFTKFSKVFGGYQLWTVAVFIVILVAFGLGVRAWFGIRKLRASVLRFDRSSAQRQRSATGLSYDRR